MSSAVMHDHRQRQPVDAEAERRAEVREPRQVDARLPARGGGVVHRPQRETQQGLDGERGNGEHAGVEAVVGHVVPELLARDIAAEQAHGERRDERPEHQGGKHPLRHAE